MKLTTKTLLCLLLTATAIGQTGEALFTKPFVTAVPYPTMDAAATAAFVNLQHQSHSDQWEYSGVLYQMPDGMYYYTSPVTSKSDRSVIGMQVLLWQGAKLVGLYHNHTALPFDEFFSTLDLDTAQRLNVASYVLRLRTQQVLRWSPGEPTVNGVATLPGLLANGSIIGNVSVGLARN